MHTDTFRFADDGDIPNNPSLPVIFYHAAIDDLRVGDPAVPFERMFQGNGWGGSWRNGVFPFPHYHSNAHEVLGIARGEAEVRLGGHAGQVFRVMAGDALLLPAGTGHQRISASDNLLVIGAYPPGQHHPDLMREGAADKVGIRQRIFGVEVPTTDPVAGATGPLCQIWTVKA